MADTDDLRSRGSQARADRASIAPVRLDLFGGFRLRDPDGQLLNVGNRKDAGLLAYLGLSPGVPHNRDKLAALLWGQSEQNRARHSLRQSISSLRRRVFAADADAIVSTPDTVMLAQGAVHTDVAALRERARNGTCEALSRALKLYRGAFLDGVHMREPPFDEWITFTRQALEGEVSGLGRQLVQRALEEQCFDYAMEGCNKLIEIDPFDEIAHRTLMECLIQVGQKRKAAQHYRSLADRLRTELGVEPEPETEEVYKRAATDGAQGEDLSAVRRSLEDAFQGFDAFVIYDPQDRFVACNRKFSELFPSCPDLFKPGNEFEYILRKMVERQCFPQALTDPEGWIRRRLDCHRRGINTENLVLADGRQMFLSQRITAQKNIVVLFTDVTESGD